LIQRSCRVWVNQVMIFNIRMSLEE
jgi:hypothetical protein